MTLAVNSILTKAYTLSSDAKRVHWLEAETLIWLAEALPLLVAKHPDAIVQRAPFDLSEGAKQTLPDEVQILLEVRTTTGAPVPLCDRAVLDAFNPKWTVSPRKNTVENHMYDPTEHPTFWVSPAQNATPATVELVYSAYSEAPEKDGTIAVQDKYESHLVNYLLYRMYAKSNDTGSMEKATAYFQLFNA